MNNYLLKKQQGFSLVELAIVIAITGIIFSAALPDLSSLYEKSEKDTLIQELEKNIKLARSEAINRKESIGIYPNSAWKDGWQIKTMGSTPEVLHSNNNSTKTLLLSSSDFTSSAPLEFNFRGTANSTGAFKVAVGGCDEMTLTINLAGQLTKQTHTCL